MTRQSSPSQATRIVTLDDYRWLTSGEAEPWIDRADGEPTVARTAALRRQLSAARTHLILEQVELRRRAQQKFTHAARMFFTRQLIEQASDEIVAAYKASRFPSHVPLADLCCGLGGDLLALAARGATIGVDRDPIAAWLAAANVRAALGCACEMVTADVRSIDLASVAAWHIDPDRRPSGRRTTKVEWHEPAPEVIDRLLAANPHGAIKLAPAGIVPDDWSAAVEQEWLSRDGECRQLVAWFGDLARHRGRRAATILSAGAPPRTVVGDEHVHAPIAGAIARYVYEPDAAVIAARLTGALAAEHGLSALAARVAYLTGDRPLDDPALSSFAVREVLPFDQKRLRGALAARGIGRLEIKKRGVEFDVEKLRGRLRLDGDHQATLLITPQADRTIAILAERVVR